LSTCHYWHFKKSLLGNKFNFLKSDNCPFIIRLNPDDTFTIYDTRKYAQMKSIDFNFHGYSVISHHKNLLSAKAKVRKLLKKEGTT